jgi:hypothetical protein
VHYNKLQGIIPSLLSEIDEIVFRGVSRREWGSYLDGNKVMLIALNSGGDGCLNSYEPTGAEPVAKPSRVPRQDATARLYALSRKC